MIPAALGYNAAMLDFAPHFSSKGIRLPWPLAIAVLVVAVCIFIYRVYANRD